MTDKDISNRSHLWVWITGSLVCVLGLVGTYVLFVEAPPPRRVVIAAGGKDGAYYKFAQLYAKLLAAEGITLEVLPTHGSVENLKLLQDEDSDVSVAFMQTGIIDPNQADSLQALGSLYREPLWIFYRGAKTVDRLTQLKGWKVAIGAEGSGTRGIASQLLSANGIGEDTAEFLEIGGTDAAAALESGDIDAAFFVAGMDAAYIQRLLRAPGIHLAELAQSEAYQRQFRFLSSVIIHAGLIDIEHNIPAKDRTLIAPAATLVAHDSLHPALASMLLKAASKVHKAGDRLAKSGEFPSASFTDIPLSDDAERYFRVGPPVLQRILPFWLASMVDRLKIMVIPLIMLLMPLFRIAPPLVRWQTRRKIYMWYARLRKIDRRAIHGMSQVEAKLSRDELYELEKQIARIGVPLSYMEEYYNLRLHLDLVSSKVDHLLGRAHPVLGLPFEGQPVVPMTHRKPGYLADAS